VKCIEGLNNRVSKINRRYIDLQSLLLNVFSFITYFIYTVCPKSSVNGTRKKRKKKVQTK
jgi:hypothetical protein